MQVYVARSHHEAAIEKPKKSICSRRLTLCPPFLGILLPWRLDSRLTLSNATPLCRGQPPQIRCVFDIFNAVNLPMRILLLGGDLNVAEEEGERPSETEEGQNGYICPKNGVVNFSAYLRLKCWRQRVDSLTLDVLCGLMCATPDTYCDSLLLKTEAMIAMPTVPPKTWAKLMVARPRALNRERRPTACSMPGMTRKPVPTPAKPSIPSTTRIPPWDRAHVSMPTPSGSSVDPKNSGQNVDFGHMLHKNMAANVPTPRPGV